MGAQTRDTWHVWLTTDVYPPVCGGSGWSAHALARVLLDEGHRVRVLVLDPTGDDIESDRYDEVEVTRIGVRAARRSPVARLGAHDYAHRRIASFLDRALREESEPVDVLHAQHLHTGPPTVQVGRAHRCATVTTLRDYWPVCLHGTSWWGGSLCEGCTAASLRGCMTEYWGWPSVAAGLMLPWARRRLRVRASGVSDCHKVITVSETVRRRVEPLIPDADLVVVPNIVDPRRVDSLASGGVKATTTRPFLLAAGKLQPTKGFDLLLRAMAEATVELPLRIAGDGPSREGLERLAVTLDVDAEFLGWVDHDRLLALQREAVAVVLPSAWDEPLSRVVLETMGLGTPVVAWRRGGNREIIDSGRNGWLVETPADLTAAVREVVSPARRAEVGREARRLIEERYAPSAVYPQVAAVYRDAMAKVSVARGAVT